MSTISEYLKQILSARYGKDVRQAIHDSIKQCYDDGRSGSIDLMARNQIEALNNSMIDMSSEVGDRIKYTDVVDNLKSTDADKPLSANQGKALNDAIGTADISAIGDGTVKGAINELDTSKANVQVVITTNGFPTMVADIGAKWSEITTGTYGTVIVNNGATLYHGTYYKYSDKVGSIHMTDCTTGIVYVWNCNGGDYQLDEIGKAKDFLPLTGGTLTGRLDVDNGLVGIWGTQNSATIAHSYNGNFSFLNVSEILELNSAVQYVKNGGGVYNLFGEHNKPSGSYNGNGSSAKRTVDIGGFGDFLLISASNTISIVAEYGCVSFNTGSSVMGYLNVNEVNFRNGVLTIATDNAGVNYSGALYKYQVL